MIGVISTQWLLDELFTNNAVTMTTGGNATTFVKLVDGSYNPQFGSADTLIDNMDGTFTVKSPQQLSWNFNTDGQLATYVDPAGVTVTYNYVDGKLHTVTNGMGRTLTSNYDDRLDTVSDGNGRSVSFTIADGNLTEFTNAEGKTTTFEYEAPGLLTAFYLPANPLIAIMLNTYDSLGRVMTQTLANQGEAQYFLAGSRAEYVDPVGNSSIMYFNSVGLPVLEIDALENRTVHEYDGLNRETKTTYPELNSTECTFDNNNNVLTLTSKAKPGSGLSDIVNSFEYDEDWNKVSKTTDGEGNETNFAYDPTQGTLLTITRPEIDSQIPTVQYTWTARGQVETRRDETGIVDKFLYSGDNETMDTAIRDFNDLDPGHLNIPTNFAYNAWGDVIPVLEASETQEAMSIATRAFPSHQQDDC